MVNLAKFYLLCYQATEIYKMWENIYWKITPQMSLGTSKMSKKFKWVIFKENSSLVALYFHGYGRVSNCSEVLTYQATLWNQSEIMRTSKEPPGTSKRAKTAKWGIFKGDHWHTFSRLGRHSCCSELSGHLMEQIRYNGNSNEPSGISKRAKRDNKSDSDVIVY